jgi:multidrug transporter EmrE-like cation transporter
MAWVYVTSTIVLTIYGQIVVKWQLLHRGHLPPDISSKIAFFVGFFTDPWIISVLIGTAIAALSWVAALSRLELSRAYPFTALSFVIVLVLSSAFFGEPLTPAKVLGIGFVVTGLVVGVSL